MTGQPAKPRDRRVRWRCFHCNATFTREQMRLAREHFGADQLETPVCLMRVPGEAALLTALREAQDTLRRYQAEDSPVIRAMLAMEREYPDRYAGAKLLGYELALSDVTAGRVEPDLARRIIAALTRVLTDKIA